MNLKTYRENQKTAEQAANEARIPYTQIAFSAEITGQSYYFIGFKGRTEPLRTAMMAGVVDALDGKWKFCNFCAKPTPEADNYAPDDTEYDSICGDCWEDCK